jgi:hypothetical protein
LNNQSDVYLAPVCAQKIFSHLSVLTRFSPSAIQQVNSQHVCFLAQPPGMFLYISKYCCILFFIEIHVFGLCLPIISYDTGQ